MSDFAKGDYVTAGFTTYRVVHPVYRWQRIDVVDAIEIRGTDREGTAPRRLPVSALTKLEGPPVIDVHLPDRHVHTAVCEHRLISHEVPGVSECYSCGPHIRDQYCPHACTVVAEEATMPDTTPVDVNADTGPERYPAQVSVYCDSCGHTHSGDYIVGALDDKATRFGYARTHLRVNQGWICDDRGDYCPACAPAVAADPAHPTLVTHVQPVSFTDRAMFTDTETAVLKLHGAKRLGYLAAQDEWTNGDEPLSDAMQQAANRLYHAGWLPEIAAGVSR